MRPVSNISVASHAWAAALDKINEMAYVFSTVAVTLEANTIGAVNTGNGWVNGTFGANTIAVIDGLRGGTIATAANLTVTSNLLASSNVWLNGALLTVASNVVVNGATTVNALAAVGLATLSTANITSTAELRGVTTAFANVIPTSNAAVIQLGRATGRFLIFANTGNFSGDVTMAALTATDGVFSGNVTVSGDANVAGNLNVTGSMTFVGTSAADFNPSANVTYSLGNTTMSWLGIDTQALVVNSTATTFRTRRVDLPASTNTIASFRLTPSAAGGVDSLTAANGDVWLNTVNSTYQVIQSHVAGAVQNVAFATSTVNAASQLATTRYINLTGDVSGSATFNGTSNADITVTVGTVDTANDTTYLNGQLAAYYIDIPARLGYTPTNKAGDTGVGSLIPAANTTAFGNTIQRWVITANSLDLSSTLAVTGLATLSTANITSTLQLRGVTTAFANINPTANATNLGLTNARWVIYANTIDASGTITGNLVGTANNADYFNSQQASYYTNATNLATGTVPEARLTQANSTTNGIMRVLDSIVNTSILIAASANSVKTAYDNATTSYANAVLYVSNVLSSAQTISGTWTHTGDVILNSTATPSANSAGYRIFPQNSRSAAYQFVATDANKAVVHPDSDTTVRTFTIANNATEPMANGTSFIVPNGYLSNTITIAGGTGVTIRLTGTATTGSRTLAKGGIATCYKFSTDEWWVSGPGVT